MKPLVVHSGLVAPLNRSNVDTDAILPKAFLKSIERVGFGPHLFDDWRYCDPWREEDDAPRAEQPDFVLNRSPYRDATILLAGANFGCGSSREHAVWALTQFGFRAVLAESFSDIFHSNAIRNGLLPAKFAHADVDALFRLVDEHEALVLTIDLRQRQVETPSGQKFVFDLDGAARHMLMNGLDEIGLTLQRRDEIRHFEDARLATQPWI